MGFEGEGVCDGVLLLLSVAGYKLCEFKSIETRNTHMIDEVVLLLPEELEDPEEDASDVEVVGIDVGGPQPLYRARNNFSYIDSCSRANRGNTHKVGLPLGPNCPPVQAQSITRVDQSAQHYLARSGRDHERTSVFHRVDLVLEAYKL